MLFGVLKDVFWARNALLNGMYCILYSVNFANLQFHAKMTHLSRKRNKCLTKVFMAIFALAERLPTSATLLQDAKPY